MRIDGGFKQPPVQPNSIQDPRMRLQALLLRKALEQQPDRQEQQAPEVDGKGQILDIRV